MDPAPNPIAARRADIDAKQEQIAHLLEEMGCEAALLLLPAHVAWFTSGMTVSGLLADSERPGIFTNGRQRWLVCSSVDSQRFFDENLDQLGFQLKEWSWEGGRAELLQSICSGRKMTADRPYSNTPLINEKLRPLWRVPSAFERERLLKLGHAVAHAVEATARIMKPGEAEEEAAGRIGHHLLHHGIEPVVIHVAADDRGRKYRRAGFTAAPAHKTCFLQATAQKDGLFATAGRTVCFGSPDDAWRAEFDHAARVAAVFRALSRPGETVTAAAVVAAKVLTGTDYEFEGRLSIPGHACGRYPAEELRRGGRDEPFVEGLPIVWQARVGAAAVVDTVFVSAGEIVVATPPVEWPFKRIRVGEKTFDVPDLLETMERG